MEDDAELIVAAGGGSTEAFGRLIARYQADAVRIAAVAAGSADHADDIAQEAFVKIHRALPRFDPDRPFKPWLYRIVTNTALTHHRSTGRRRSLRLKVASLASPGDPGPDEVTIRLADRQRVITAINRLDHNDRLILTYRWYDQLTEAEMAAALDCPQGTVKSRLSRAMSRLRRELDSDSASESESGGRP